MPANTSDTACAISKELTWVLLPGFDGTGNLFEPLRKVIPARSVQVISYSPDEPKAYEDLVQQVLSEVPDRPYVLIAESFSGPIAIQVAALAQRPPQALVLCATFAAWPFDLTLRRLSRLLSPMMFRSKPPRWIVQHFLLGANVPQELMQQFFLSVGGVNRHVLQARLNAVLRVDVRSALAGSRVPVLYLCAAKDRLIGRRGLRTVEKVCGDLLVRTIDAPHLMLQRNPQECVNAIEEFTERTTAKR